MVSISGFLSSFSVDCRGTEFTTTHLIAPYKYAPSVTISDDSPVDAVGLGLDTEHFHDAYDSEADSKEPLRSAP